MFLNRTALAAAYAGALWTVMTLLALAAAARWLVLPLYLEPLLEREVHKLSAQISRHLRQGTSISYRMSRSASAGRGYTSG